jgi:hypothetical protein
VIVPIRIVKKLKKGERIKLEILLDASRNKEFVENNRERLEEIKSMSEESSGYSQKKFRGVYISPEEEAKLLEQFSTVVTQDFEDEYHMSSKERADMKQRYEKFFKLKNFTKKIRRLDKFVEAYRICMDIVNDIAETNGIYSPEEFKKKVMSGAITITGLQFPKFQGKKKKRINWDYVAEFVADPTRDIRELTEQDEIAQEAEVTANSTESELDYYLRPLAEEEQAALDFRLAKEDDGVMIGAEIDKKHQKNLLKKVPSMVKIINDAGKSAQSARGRAHVWDMDSSEMQALKSYDDAIRGKSELAMPKFSGKIHKTSDVDAYVYALDEYLKNNTYVEYNGRLVTEADKEEMEYLAALENAGWNLRNLYDNKDKEKRDKKASKDELKRIKVLRKTLATMQERSSLREKGYTSKEIERILEEKASKGKKKKKKAKKKIDGILLDAVNSDEEDFKAYAKKMSKLTGGN